MSDSVIAVDWGTSSFRAYLLDAAGGILERREAAGGILRVRGGDFAAALLAEVGDWLKQAPDALVIMSGMIGSRQGWREIPYVDCPAALSDIAGGLERVDWGEGEAWIVPGLLDESRPDQPDVMRGEETQVLGALAQMPAGGGLVCLPGTHSKWVTVENGAIQGFATYMTGEVYDLLQGHSILGRLMTKGAVNAGRWFLEGVGLAQEGGLLNRLFTARSRVLAGDLPEDEVRSYLSGLLIGDELASTVGAGESAVFLLGAPALTVLYEAALGKLGKTAVTLETDAVAAGLFALAQHLRKGGS
ncbi:2-dehydro-3-deoxygalactonokinase [Pelagibius marinus]|uniref:2-dehydro-3-deoxygalactonokinase n=1 Tax=Pelagibius marinus TaxID=2762760 RepID=UPI0018727719|nr:2-dehydro-3-deoxygalactonokinase [Pelagibius marinus]